MTPLSPTATMVQDDESFWGGVRGGPFCKKDLPENSSEYSQVLQPFLAVSILADGQFNGKGASFAGMAFHFYASLMILNNAVTDREA
jgi:hypothetical protein